MITAKFGGTAVTPRNLTYVKQCLTSAHKCVVVSAVGKEHDKDTKATDLLKQYYLTRNEALWSEVENKYRRLVEVNSVSMDADKMLYYAHLRATQFNLDYCMSLGEEMSAKVVAKYLGATYVEAEQTVRFGKRSLLYKETVRNLSSAFKGVELAVTGGFYGGCDCSRRTFSRGGSDITGSLCAVATGSELYENWTDSYGVCVANPAKVFDVATVFNLSYDEMFELSRAGAEVLHPYAVRPCQSRAIPIKIGNFYNPYGQSTLVSNCPSSRGILSVAERLDERGNTVTTVLHSLSQSRITQLFSEFFASNAVQNDAFGKRYFTEKISVLDFNSTRAIAKLVTDRSVIAPLYNFLKEARAL